MLALVIILSVLCIVLGVVAFFSIRRNLEYADKLEEVGDQIERSLDVLDTCYQRAAARAELEVMSDEPVVRELVDDLRTCREAILLVANLIVDPLTGDEEGNE